jgi:OOP family OmpA-OmpF porin
MISHLVRYMTALSVVASMSLPSAAIASQESDPSSNKIGIVDYELKRVEFQPGRPSAGESFEDSAKNPSTIQVRLLEQNATFLKDMPPQVGAEVAGSTDTQECKGMECRELSLRRAQCVYKWLIDHGVPASKLSGPKGDGTDYPIGDNDTEEGRQFNRRVQLNFVRLR